MGMGRSRPGDQPFLTEAQSYEHAQKGDHMMRAARAGVEAWLPAVQCHAMMWTLVPGQGLPTTLRQERWGQGVQGAEVYAGAVGTVHAQFYIMLVLHG